MKAMSKILILFGIILCVVNIYSQNSEILTDTRDGKSYKTVVIGTQTWMAQNLDFECKGSFCNYCDKFGRLYKYNVALKACPSGWHLPNDAEWQAMIDFLGGNSVAGGKLKVTNMWSTPNTGASNSSGFSALPAGYSPDGKDIVLMMRTHACFWTSTPNGSDAAMKRILFSDKSEISGNSSNRSDGLSVRCIKD